MNVHIVNRVTDTGIVSEMAQWLADVNGWSISDEPDPSAAVNYYMPYLEYDALTAPDTKTAAWFTHFETGNAWKESRWHSAAFNVNLPLITAPGEMINLPFARVIVPGVDRDRFRPLNGVFGENGRTAALPVVGTAGVGQPRKGPHLITDLFYSGLRVEIKLAGSGWPFPHHNIKPRFMPDFYNALDAYLCTSLIEGIPMPVLEALACGTKVVIPDGVGICDMLPEMPGIRHYPAGNSRAMIETIRRVLVDKPKAGALREVTEDYTIEHWCKSHTAAMEASFATISV